MSLHEYYSAPQPLIDESGMLVAQRPKFPDAAIRRAEAMLATDNPVSVLQQDSYGDIGEFEARQAIIRADSSFLLKRYGSEVLFWAAVTTTNEELGTTHMQELAKVGFDPRLIKKSRQFCWEEAKNNQHQRILREYSISNSLANIGSAIDIESILTQNFIAGVVPSKKRIADYKVDSGLSTKDYSYGRFEKSKDYIRGNVYFDLYLDGPAGAILTYKNTPQAILSMSSTEHADEALIRQIQGVRGKVYSVEKDVVDSRTSARGLAPLQWRNLLVDIGAVVARQSGMGTLVVQGGQNNKWVKPTPFTNDVHLPQAIAITAYDETARRLGFELGEDMNWRMPTADYISQRLRKNTRQ